MDNVLCMYVYVSYITKHAQTYQGGALAIVNTRENTSERLMDAILVWPVL